MPKESSPKAIGISKESAKADADYIAQVTTASANALADAAIRFAVNYNNQVLNIQGLTPADRSNHLQLVVSPFLTQASSLIDGLIDGVRTGPQQAKDK